MGEAEEIRTKEGGGPEAPALPFPAPRYEILSWCMFDFANSSFTTIISTVVFGVYFTSVVCEGLAQGVPDLLWSIGNLVSQGIILVTAPIVGAIADRSASKKRFLAVTWAGCSIFAALLGVVRPGDIVLGLALFVVANLFYSAGENLIAAFLPELARPADMGKVSGYGWALGYLGGLVSLAICLPFLGDEFSSANQVGLRLTSVIVGIFFLICGLPTMLFLRERAVGRPLPPGTGYVGHGFRTVLDTLRHVRTFRDLSIFLLVFLVYNMGIAIVVQFAGIYAKTTLGFGTKELALMFILLQVSSAASAFAFGYLQDRLGARRTIAITLVLWFAVCLLGAVVRSKAPFLVVANLAGLAIGGSQSAARALVGTFAPTGRSAEFFGFWALVWKLSAAVGPLAFGIASAWTGSQRIAILVTGVFFLAGLLGLGLVDEARGRKAAEAASAAA